MRTAPSAQRCRAAGDGHAQGVEQPHLNTRLDTTTVAAPSQALCDDWLLVNYFPIFFDLNDQPVLVVGGGEVALRKVSLLERCGARITVVAPEIMPELKERAERTAITHVPREFAPSDLEGARLVIVATSKRAVNRWIATLSEARGIPVNVVDDKEASRFIVPAIIDRDPVIVAISTGGTSPVLARRLRERLEAFIPKRFGDFALWLRNLRQTTMDKLRDTQERRRFFETLVDGPAAKRFIDGDQRGALRIAQQLLATTANAPRASGEVALVGAGPGDAELLTLKALRAIQDADLILYDRLVSPAILDMARRDASLVCVGKSAGETSTSQDEINALLVKHAEAGKRVVRLKGGDPFIFGRGGEELQALAAAGINFSVIPGITAALGIAAYAGIPLTHRDYAHSVSFVTGHADRNGKEPDWRALAAPGATAVFYMGLGRLEHIVRELLAAGASADRPAALVAQGTLPAQRIITATLGTIVACAAHVTLESPALLVVGDVVALHSTLSWFNVESGPDLSQSA
jgi:uroporphyrin-III C-methyltransferase/precorrin-2 dehydrogenase/sirohydrochlorin ferrochelatase